MKLNIRGDKVEVTKSIREYVESKIGKLDRYFDSPDNINANVVIRVRNNEQVIEVTILTKKYTLRAEESHKDLYAACDLVVDKLERQIRKNKTKLNERYKTLDIVEMRFDYEVKPSEEEEEVEIVKRKDVEMKPMDEEEAILEMNLINHDFFAFKNINEECVSVVYRRKDGKYGIINVK